MIKEVKLNDAEYEFGVAVGTERHERAVKLQLDPMYLSETPKEKHILGAMGEIVASKHFGVDFSHMGSDEEFKRRHNGDVLGYEVKCSSRPFLGELLLKEEHKPLAHRKFIHIRQCSKYKFHIVGWAFGYEALVPDWKQDFEIKKGGGLVYLYPNRLLRNINNIKETTC